jgi:hypothetical protein
MTIEIHQPELEALIHQRMASGRFESVEDLLFRTLEASAEVQSHPPNEETLDQVFAVVRGMFADGELDFSRSASAGRPVDLS